MSTVYSDYIFEIFSALNTLQDIFPDNFTTFRSYKTLYVHTADKMKFNLHFTII